MSKQEDTFACIDWHEIEKKANKKTTLEKKK